MTTEPEEIDEEIAARKRAELDAAFERGEVSDPFSATFFISLAVSAALGGISYLAHRAFAPKPPKLQQGKLSGSVQLQNSEQGVMIPEIYGASPSFSLTAGANPNYQNIVNCTTGAGGSITKSAGGTAWNAGASHNVSPVSGNDAFFEFTVGTGYATAGFTTTASPVSGNADFLFGAQWNPDGSVTIKYSNTLLHANATHWVTGDRFRVELRSGRFRLYKGAAEIRPQNFVPPTPTYPCWLGIAIFTTGAGISEGKVLIGNIGSTPNAGRGGIKVPAIIVYSSGIRKNVTTTEQPTGGGKGGGSRTQTVENITYDIDLATKWCRGPARLLREFANADILIDQVNTSPLPSGVYDPTTGADTNYDPLVPPDPSLNYITPIHRIDGDIAFDVNNAGAGTIQGGGSLFAIYEGNTVDDPDPTVEADIDAKFGFGSTPAFRRQSAIVHKNFLLSRWGGIVPNLTAVWEHSTLATLDDIYGSLTERVGLTSGDYDYTSLSGINCRGLLIQGRLFSPAEVVDDEEIQSAYSYLVTEAEGKIYGYAEGSEPTVTIADTEIGWLDSDADLPDIIPEVESRISQESSLARQVDVKFIDPDNNWDPNTQSAKRQVTDGVGVELLEVQLCLLADEARATAQRRLYRQYVAGTAHKFTLPWTYLYLHPGYKITINRAEGFSHVLRLNSISGGVGVLECEGIALEPQVYNQPAVGAFNGLPEPNVETPAMTVAMLLDTPLLREGDITNNDGVGQYVVGMPRTGFNQQWKGFALYKSVNNQWIPQVTSDVPGTVGTIVAVSLLSTDPFTVDNAGRIVVDLYGTNATLSSVTEADIIAGANLAVAGDTVFNFATATQVPDNPNRWELKKLLNGQKETDAFISLVAVGDRFVLVNDAVKFFPMDIADLGNTRSYRAVTSGQSLGDAATLTHVWTGNMTRARKVSDVTIVKDASNDYMIQFIGHPRLLEQPATYAIEVWPDAARANPANIKRTLPVTDGTSHASLIDATGDLFFEGGGDAETTHADKNNLIWGTGALTLGQTIEALTTTYTRFDFSFRQAPNAVSGDFILAGLEHDTSFSTANRGVDDANSPVVIKWKGNGVDLTTIVEEIRSFGSLIATRTLPYFIDAPTRYSILLSGTEYRVYSDYVPAGGNKPLAIISSPSAGFPFPLRLKMTIQDSGIAGAKGFVDNVMAGGALVPATIYSSAQQIVDFGAPVASLYLRIYQRGLAPRPDGFPVDVEFQTFGGSILLESGGTDELLTEANDKLLKE